jgi:hypothetical protein
MEIEYEHASVKSLQKIVHREYFEVFKGEEALNPKV